MIHVTSCYMHAATCSPTQPHVAQPYVARCNYWSRVGQVKFVKMGLVRLELLIVVLTCALTGICQLMCMPLLHAKKEGTPSPLSGCQSLDSHPASHKHRSPSPSLPTPPPPPGRRPRHPALFPHATVSWLSSPNAILGWLREGWCRCGSLPAHTNS